MTVPRRDWLTASEVAAQFDVTPQAVRLWILTNQLEAEQALMGTWLIHESAIEQFRADRAAAHNCNTHCATCNGKPSIRPSVSNGARAIDPAKRYRLKSTGEVVTGAELLGTREGNGTPQ